MEYDEDYEHDGGDWVWGHEGLTMGGGVGAKRAPAQPPAPKTAMPKFAPARPAAKKAGGGQSVGGGALPDYGGASIPPPPAWVATQKQPFKLTYGKDAPGDQVKAREQKFERAVPLPTESDKAHDARGWDGTHPWLTWDHMAQTNQPTTRESWIAPKPDAAFMKKSAEARALTDKYFASKGMKGWNFIDMKKFQQGVHDNSVANPPEHYSVFAKDTPIQKAFLTLGVPMSVIVKPGYLPLVAPPRAKYGKDWWMEPTWQTGDDTTLRLYRQYLVPKLHPKFVDCKLTYTPPMVTGWDASRQKWDGAWTWRIDYAPEDSDFDGGDSNPDAPYQRVRKATGKKDGFMKAMGPNTEGEEAYWSFGGKQIEMWIQNGVPLPPWALRGRFAWHDLIRKYCK